MRRAGDLIIFFAIVGLIVGVFYIDKTKNTKPQPVEEYVNEEEFGNFCIPGFDIFINIMEANKNADKEMADKYSKEMIKHCEDCLGCRNALFKKDEWEKAKKEYEQSKN